MARISPTPKFRAFDSNGDPLSGGKLYTYEAGTTTPKTTFTDANEGTPNANPIILDSDGYADLWLGAGSYKFVLDDANDVTIYTVDNIEGDAATVTTYTISTTTNIDATYANGVILASSSPTLNLLAASSAGDGFYIDVKNTGSGVVTIDPNASETIDGAATLTINAGYSARIYCNSTAWFALFDNEEVTFSDADFEIFDDGDNTKIAKFQASGITTGTTRTYTFPDNSGTLALTSDVTGQAQPQGQCYLEYTNTTTLTLTPYDGQNIRLYDGASWTNYTIPSAGVTLDTTGLSTSTTYYIYAYDNSSTITLEASATGYVTDTDTGYKVKSGDDTRLLVGMARTNGSTQYSDNLTISYFNRKIKNNKTNYSADRTTTSLTYVEINSEIRNEFLTWPDESVNCAFMGVMDAGATNVGYYVAIGVDGTTNDGAFVGNPGGNGVDQGFACHRNTLLSEGYHYFTGIGKTTNASFGVVARGSGTAGDRCIIEVNFKG